MAMATMPLNTAAGLVVLLGCCCRAGASTPSYWHSYNSFVQSQLDSVYINRTEVFTTKSMGLSDVVGRPAAAGGSSGTNKWFLSNATADVVNGAVRLSAHAVGNNASMAAKPVYGTLWLGEKLPLDGVAVEWSYMFDDTANAHDMNWWFPCPVPNNAVYSSYGESNPFYVWGINVRRRLPSTPLRIMCQPTAAHP
jgi:hypothetical protein